MTQKAKQSHASSNSVVPIVLFGLDDHGKPKAARFVDKHADLAAKAAEQLQLQVLAITDPEIADLAARLPVGRIHANGRGLVPYIRRELYDKLIAAAGPAGSEQGTASSPTGGGGAGSSSRNGAGAAAAALPRNWDEIAPGHLIIVQETLEDGWYDTVVLERSGDMLTVRWRDYPRDRKFTRHHLTVALSYPNGQSSAAPAAKTGLGKGSSRPGAKLDQPFPTNWDEIDVDHLVLAKQDGPWAGWWEAVPIENHGDTLTLRWRDYPNLPAFVRPRLSLALLHPKP